MICPQCGAEYVEGVSTCRDCGVDLVAELREPEPQPKPMDKQREPRGDEARLATTDPPDDPPEKFSLVTVFSGSDPGLLAIAKSLLQSAGIPFVAQGEGIQDLFGIGRMAACNPITGPAALCVAPEDEADARALLANLTTDAEWSAADWGEVDWDAADPDEDGE